MHFSLAPDSNYCSERDLGDRSSSCFGEGIISHERATDLTETKVMFADTSFHLLQDLSWQEEAAIWSCHPYSGGRGCICLCQGPLALSVLESVCLGLPSKNGDWHNAGIQPARSSCQLCLPGNWLSQHKAIPTFPTLFVALECLLTTFFTAKHLWKEHSTTAKLEGSFISNVWIR